MSQKWLKVSFFQNILRCLSDPQTLVKNQYSRTSNFKFFRFFLNASPEFYQEILGLFTFAKTVGSFLKLRGKLKN